MTGRDARSRSAWGFVVRLAVLGLFVAGAFCRVRFFRRLLLLLGRGLRVVGLALAGVLVIVLLAGSTLVFSPILVATLLAVRRSRFALGAGLRRLSPVLRCGICRRGVFLLVECCLASDLIFVFGPVAAQGMSRRLAIGRADLPRHLRDGVLGIRSRQQRGKGQQPDDQDAADHQPQVGHQRRHFDLSLTQIAA